jgi:hypothetical protein
MKPILGSISMTHLSTPLGAMIALTVIVVLGIIIKVKVIPNICMIVAEVKAQLFTIAGVVSSFIHVMILVGFISTWVMFNVKVMGNDVMLSPPTFDGQ